MNTEQSLKRRKIEVIEELPPSTKLTDVNNDCLEKIFKYLSIDDLLNIAHTNKQLKPAADLAFNSNFGKEMFGLGVSRTYGLEYYKLNEEVENVLKVLRLMRCFGHLISTLKFVNINYYAQYLQYLSTYISEYCADSVKEVEFGQHIPDNYKNPNYSSILSDYKMKPLLKAKKLTMHNYVELNAKWLNTQFPNITHLNLNEWYLSHENSTEFEFEFRIEHLEMTTPIRGLNFFLRFCPHLKSLLIKDTHNSNVIQKISKNLERLEHLESLNVWIYSTKSLNVEKPIYLKKLKILKIVLAYQCCEYNTPAWHEIPFFPFVCHQLDELKYILRFHPLSDGLIGFATTHPSITKLWIHSVNYKETQSEENKMKIVKALPLLKEINFLHFFHFDTIDQVTNLIGELKFLNKLEFSGMVDFQQLQAQLGNDWYVEQMEYTVKLERKIGTN